VRDLTPTSEQIFKPTATIHVGNKLSLIERKVFNTIIWHSQKNRLAKSSDTLSLALLMSVIGLERSKNLDVIKEAIEKLTTTPIVWNTLKKDRTTDWGICTFLAGAEISTGQLRYVVNPLLAEKVNHPTLFAKIQLLVQREFSSKYSLALYEFLVDELSRAGTPKTHEVQVALDTVRHILQFDGEYKHLHSDVLKPCVQEINKHTDISVGYRGVKQGRAVIALLFSIERTAVQLQMPLDDLKILEGGDEDNLPPKEVLALSLVERGVGARKAKELVETYDEERIRENITYAETEHRAGKVKKLSAFVIRAIEEDYRPKKTEDELRNDAKSAQKHTGEEDVVARDELEKEWHLFRSNRVRELFEVLPENEKQARKDAYVEKLREADTLLYRQYRKTGFESRLVETQFFSQLREELLTTAEETSIDAYRTSRQYGKT